MTEEISSYRVTDLPVANNISKQDLFIIAHMENGQYGSQSVNLRTLVDETKSIGFSDELDMLNSLAINAAMKQDVSIESRNRVNGDENAVAQSKAYTDSVVSKVHSHKNLNVLSAISGMNISQWANDSGYITQHQPLDEYATKEYSDANAANAVHEAKAYTEEQVGKLHTHGNLSVLSGITGKAISQWQNDAGYEISSNLGSMAYAESSDYVTKNGIVMSYTSADGVLTLSTDRTSVSAKIMVAGSSLKNTYAYCKNNLSADGYCVTFRDWS